MTSRRRHVVDTHLYIDALRSEQGRDALASFQGVFAPFLHFSAVVAQELRAGIPAHAAAKFEAAMFAPYERRGRLITPSYAAWKETGGVLAELVASAGTCRHRRTNGCHERQALGRLRAARAAQSLAPPLTSSSGSADGNARRVLPGLVTVGTRSPRRRRT